MTRVGATLTGPRAGTLERMDPVSRAAPDRVLQGPRPGGLPPGDGLPQRRRRRRSASTTRSARSTARPTAGRRCPASGPKTAKVIAQAWAGREPDTLVELRSAAADLGGGEIRAALKGDLHLHSNWSDGSAPIEEMMATAQALGPRVLRADRPLAAPDGRQRAVAGAAAQAARRHRRTARDGSRPCASSPASRSTSSTTAPSTRRPNCSSASTSWWPACTPS